MRRAIAVWLLLVPLTARAQQAGPAATAKSTASQLIDEGNALLEHKEYQAALARYRAAHELYPTPKIFYNMAEALRELDQLVEAAEHLERFLAESGVPKHSPLRRAASKALAQLEGRLGRVTIGGGSFGAEVFVDGKPAGRVPVERLRVLPGTRQVVIQKEGFDSKEMTIEVTAGAETELDGTLERTAPPMAPPPPPLAVAPPPPVPPPVLVVTAPVETEEPSSIAGRWWFWTIIGGTVAVAAGATALAFTLRHSEPYQLGGDLGVSSTGDWRKL